VCCSVLQCVAVCCSVSQHVAVCCSVLQCVAACCRTYSLILPSVLACVFHSALRGVNVHRRIWQRVAVRCSVLQRGCVLQRVCVLQSPLSQQPICLPSLVCCRVLGVLQRVAVSCGALQCVVARVCSVLQCCCSVAVRMRVAACCSMLQRVAACCSEDACCSHLSTNSQYASRASCVATCCSLLQRVAACCSVLQRVAARVCVLQLPLYQQPTCLWSL